MYQRGKIPEDSRHVEHKKRDGSLLLIGVHTLLPKGYGGDIITEIELIRSTEGERGQQIENARAYRATGTGLPPMEAVRTHNLG